jgi:hypothetical protein
VCSAVHTASGRVVPPVQRHAQYVVSCSYPDLVPSAPTSYAPEDALYYHD